MVAAGAAIEGLAVPDEDVMGEVSAEAAETGSGDSSCLLRGMIFPVNGKISPADSTGPDTRAATAA